MSRALRVIAAIAIAAAAGYALQRWTFEPLRCAHVTWRAQRAIDEAEQRGEGAIRRVALDEHAELLECEHVPTHDLFFVLGNASMALGDPRSALTEYRRALELDRRPETYFALGTSALDALDRRAAIDDMARACAFDPARLSEIRYDDVRNEVAARIRATYGDDWLR